ncbi:MAG: DUF4381 domain-containing protein [Gammaproteobacteria bacterium]|nr:DUF4381 domain-containing protein [Gammaproteobacteria bacterium]
MNDLQQLPLRDIHLPEAVSWWPPGYGWWLLPLALGVVFWIAWWLIRCRPARRRSVRLRKVALRELDTIEAQYLASRDPRTAVAAMSMLLRRLALSLAPREQVAALTGEQWLLWLGQRCDEPGFLATAAALTELPYQPDPKPDVMALLSGCRALVNFARETGSAA